METPVRKHRTMGNDKVFPPHCLMRNNSPIVSKEERNSPVPPRAHLVAFFCLWKIKFMMQLFSDLLDFGNRIACSSSTGHGRRR